MLMQINDIPKKKKNTYKLTLCLFIIVTFSFEFPKWFMKSES